MGQPQPANISPADQGNEGARAGRDPPRRDRSSAKDGEKRAAPQRCSKGGGGAGPSNPPAKSRSGGKSRKSAQRCWHSGRENLAAGAGRKVEGDHRDRTS